MANNTSKKVYLQPLVLEENVLCLQMITASQSPKQNKQSNNSNTGAMAARMAVKAIFGI